MQARDYSVPECSRGVPRRDRLLALEDMTGVLARALLSSTTRCRQPRRSGLIGHRLTLIGLCTRYVSQGACRAQSDVRVFLLCEAANAAIQASFGGL